MEVLEGLLDQEVYDVLPSLDDVLNWDGYGAMKLSDNAFSSESLTYVLKGETIEKHSATRVPLYTETVQKLNEVIV